MSSAAANSGGGGPGNDLEKGRRAYSALTDRALITEVRSGDPRAWEEFMVRFRGPLEEFARSARIPEVEWPVCVQEVIEEALVRLSDPSTPMPSRVGAYLIRMAKNEFLQIRRKQERARRNAEMAEVRGRDRVMRCLVSEGSRRASGESMSDESAPSTRALGSLAIRLQSSLTEEEQQILTWAGNHIPHRVIAEWSGSSYAATTKRIWRLQRRMQQLAAECRAAAEKDERREIDRFLRRVAVDTPSTEAPTAREESASIPSKDGEHADPEQQP